TFRALMPNAIVSGHSMKIAEPGIASYFNGISMGFWPANVIEGEMLFGQLWNTYQSWHQLATTPVVTMFEASPPDQIAYGYGYAPWANVPPSTLEFARTYYPWMRFGLALTLLNDGYFAYEYGDTWHGQDWRYDELDFDLGYPLGPAQHLEQPGHPSENLLGNGDFEEPTAGPWIFWADAQSGHVATVTPDSEEVAIGATSTRVDIQATAGTSWKITLAQYDRTLGRNAIYDLTFWAKSAQPRTISLYMQKGIPDWDGYGLSQRVPISTTWQEYTVSFSANTTADDARLQFAFGETPGTVWLDDVRLERRPADLYRREFSNGLVLLNGSREAQEIEVGAGWQRLSGQQAPRTDRIIDDDMAAFSTSGAWLESTYDSGEWKASGPFYHNWGKSLHERQGEQGQASWQLDITESDIYTITAWWPAAPQAGAWSQNATYEVIAGGQVVASQTVDQRLGGDQWHLIAQAPLRAEDQPFVRLQCAGPAPCVADALHIRSTARFNDGSPVDKVKLQPMDGIILRRSREVGSRYDLYLPMITQQR
nr:carbohydrate binding domain-containing protein [Caldilineaceae bacterium]